MRILGYFLFSILLSAMLSLGVGEIAGEELGVAYFSGILAALAMSILIGIRLKIALIDIAAVNSFAAFGFSFPLLKSYNGAMAPLLAIIMVGIVCASSIYLFLRILGWIGSSSMPR